MFSGSHLRILGGNFYNVAEGGRLTIGAPSDDEPYRRIQLGDIRLMYQVDNKELVIYRPCRHRVSRKEQKAGESTSIRIQLEEISDDASNPSIVGDLERTVVGAQRTYRARIFGSSDDFTVVAFDGPRGEEAKEQMLNAQLRATRHPNLLQLFGLTKAQNFSALAFHGDMIPWSYALSLFDGPVSKLGFLHASVIQLNAVHGDNPFWRRILTQSSYYPSTGIVCFNDLRVLPSSGLGYDPGTVARLALVGPNGSLPLTESECLRRLSIDEMIEVFTFLNNKEYTTFLPIPSALITATAFYICGAHNTENEVLLFPGISKEPETTNTWKRLDNTEHFVVHFGPDPRLAVRNWLLQANASLKQDRHHEKYTLTSEIAFALRPTSSKDYWHEDITLRGSFMADTPTRPVYLFVQLPQLSLTADNIAAVRLPLGPNCDETDAIANTFWSFDRDGSSRLTDDEVAEYCPQPQFWWTVDARRHHYDARDYEIVAKLLQTKGINPFDLDAGWVADEGLIQPIRKDIVSGKVWEARSEQKTEAGGFLDLDPFLSGKYTDFLYT
ncbi:hypothetical protein C8F04DRAFT_1079661 [Mycena alexandri]|uniref:Uncharacterized protein n=1 Tax=Mycena alexandri TaxID=1745969 RepID=A0AAD6XAG9_9AGAR|nr:hypothetical protein C8F04DRAFT_1079661 [Mycena alexandri]